MNRLACWGPVRRGDWVDRILIDTFRSCYPAAVISFLGYNQVTGHRGGWRRRSSEKTIEKETGGLKKRKGSW